MTRIALLLTLAMPIAAAAQDSIPTIALRAGLVITQSVRIYPRVYEIQGRVVPDEPVIIIRGSNIVVDFAGATLTGRPRSWDPDLAGGIGIRVDGGQNVVIKNARVHGYKIALLARQTRNLSILDSDFSYNWKPRLFSQVEHESLVDWLSHYKNDGNEWLRFGAGVYLSDVRGGEIRGNHIEQGMEGLMLSRTDSVRIWNNTIRFNSGVGIGLYRSSFNTIMHNHASFNVRGYSHGFFRRGQDSADLLMYEQSSFNLVAFNSMTHGGDGLFLWAGQSTMDTGQGGSNDNLFYMNDFSYAPTNGMEATFSRNTFFGNRVVGSEYGLWAGYSFDSRIEYNDFSGNRTGVAIEHGQNNLIMSNRFDGDSTAINLWANPIEPFEWGYPKHRDTKSRDYRILYNTFVRNRVALRVAQTAGTHFYRSRFDRVDSTQVIRDSSRVLEQDAAITAFEGPPTRIPGGLDPRGDALNQRDRSVIIIDEWGPYDWRSPKLWPVDSARAFPLRLRVLGPPGRWRLVDRLGVARISSESGNVGDTITVTPAADSLRNWELYLEYIGGSITLPRGDVFAAGEPYLFTWSRFEPIASWNVHFFVWPDSAHPRTKPDAFAALLKTTPRIRRTEPRLDYMWSRPAIPNLPGDKFAVVATTTVTMPGCKPPANAPADTLPPPPCNPLYTLRSISDDAIRVWIDDKLVIDNWTPHDSRVDYAPITAGTHSVRVEYYQVDGWTELRVDILRGMHNSTGSPGPH